MSEGGHLDVQPGQGAAKTGSVVSDAHERTNQERTNEDAARRAAEKRGPALIKNGQAGTGQAGNGQAGASGHRTGLQRTASAIRTMVPLLQKVLPLLEGNVISAAANLLAPALLSPTLDLAPLEASLATLRGEIASMEVRNGEHDRALKRMDEQLETMKEAQERNAHEQRQATEELSRIRTRVAVFSVIGVVLLLVSIGVNTALFLYVKGLAH